MSDLSPAPTPTNEQQDARETCRGDVLCEVPGHVIARDRGNGALGFEHVAHDAAEGLHLVTAEWDGFALSPRMVCHAPAKSTCHAVYDCDCETYYATGIEDGRPFHREDGGDGDQHFGRFDPTFCNLKEWFEVDPQEAMHGSLTFPVTAQWNGDGYEFEVVQPQVAAPSAAAPDRHGPWCVPGNCGHDYSEAAAAPNERAVPLRMYQDACREREAFRAAPDDVYPWTAVGWDDRKTLSDIWQEHSPLPEAGLSEATYSALIAVAQEGARAALAMLDHPHADAAPDGLEAEIRRLRSDVAFWRDDRNAWVAGYRALAARPAPVVSGEAMEAAAHDHQYEHFDAYETEMGPCVLVQDLPHVFAALCITVADAPAADDEGGQER